MSDKLKPCPFCGGKVKMYGDGVHGFFHMCMIDGDAMVKIESRFFESDEEAIETWNRRPKPPQGEWVDKDSFVSGFADGYKRGLAEARKWIPVTERLPENDVEVIATGVYMDHNPYVEIASCNDGRWSSYLDEYKVVHPTLHKIIAWMPLPEPLSESYEGKNET